MSTLQQAQHLYFQTDLSKTEIASSLGMSRRTLHYWIRQYNWERLKKSAEYIPSFLAESCYQILGNFTQHLLSEERKDMPVVQWEVNCMYRLTQMISKLRNRPALCETMEMMNWFTQKVTTKDPELAEKMQPHITEYIEERAKPEHKRYAPAQMQPLGFIPTPDPEKQQIESYLDEQDLLAFSAMDNTSSEAKQTPNGEPSPAKQFDTSAKDTRSSASRSLSESGLQHNGTSKALHPRTTPRHRHLRPRQSLQKKPFSRVKKICGIL